MYYNNNVKCGVYMQDIYKNLLHLLDENDSIVVAVSGGPDSMCLLNILKKIKKKKHFRLIVAHVNHNVRIESEQEKITIEKYCEDNNLLFEYLKIEKYNNDNFHDFARKKRYQFFDELIKKYNAKYLMTAHHGDDLVETIMMRLTRGSTLKGYSGFPMISECGDYKIVRPLITKTKLEIQEYMDQNKFWYAIDKSNYKDVYTRNRYRKYILPRLKDENHNVHLKFKDFSDKIRNISNFLEKYTDKVITKIYTKEKIDINEFLKEEKAVKDNILYRILQEVYQNDINLINSKHISSIYDVINSNKNISIDLPGNFKFIKEYDFCFISKEESVNNYKLEIVDKVTLPTGKNIKIIDKCNLSNNDVIYLSSEDLALPLYVRNRKKGDKILVKNMNHLKKVKDIFINEKIPQSIRTIYPIVVDSNDQIIWIPGIKKSHLDRKNTQKYDIILKYE